MGQLFVPIALAGHARKRVRSDAKLPSAELASDLTTLDFIAWSVYCCGWFKGFPELAVDAGEIGLERAAADVIALSGFSR